MMGQRVSWGSGVIATGSGCACGRSGRGTSTSLLHRLRVPVYLTGFGTCSSGIGGAANSLRVGGASRRAHFSARATRALSVAMPVLAYI